MRTWILTASLFLPGFAFALTEIYPVRDSLEKADVEIENIYQGAQGKQFTVVKTTPVLGNIADREVVIFSSGITRIMFRVGDDVFSVDASCITVHR